MEVVEVNDCINHPQGFSVALGAVCWTPSPAPLLIWNREPRCLKCRGPSACTSTGIVKGSNRLWIEHRAERNRIGEFHDHQPDCQEFYLSLQELSIQW